jgi:plasmid stabilization system protein ParE
LRRLTISAAAWRDPAEEGAFIAAKNPAAARGLRDHLLVAAARLLGVPELGPIDERGRRLSVMLGTRFRRIDRIDTAEITTLRVSHGVRQWPPAFR